MLGDKCFGEKKKSRVIKKGVWWGRSWQGGPLWGQKEEKPAEETEKWVSGEMGRKPRGDDILEMQWKTIYWEEAGNICVKCCW